MRAERLRKGDLLFRGKACGRKIRRSETFHQLFREKFHQRAAIVLRRVDDLHQCRPAPGPHSEKTAAESRTLLAAQLGWVPITKSERARYRPIARLGRSVEHERVGWIERDGAQELHKRGPPSFGSSHEGETKASFRSRRSVLSVAVRRTR